MSREQCAIVRVHVTVYGDCGHQTNAGELRRQVLTDGQVLNFTFTASETPCAECPKVRPKMLTSSAGYQLRRSLMFGPSDL